MSNVSAGNRSVAVPTLGSPDVILHTGRVYTAEAPDYGTPAVVPGFVSQAIAISGEHVTATGTNRQILALAQNDTRIINLHDRVVIPGLIDSHNHMSVLGQSILGCDISEVESIADLQDVIRAAVLASEPGAWIFTSKVGESVISHELREARYPDRWELDMVAPNNPLCVRSFHVGILNTAALDSLALTRFTQSPAGGEIGRRSYPPGELDGRFYESAWMDLVAPRLPEPSFEERVTAIELAARRLNEVGVTQVCEHGIDWNTWEAYKSAERSHRLPMKVSTHLLIAPGSHIADAGVAITEVGKIRRQISAKKRVTLDGVKVMIDGGVALGTAYFSRPYTTTYGERSNGILVTQPERLRAIVRSCLENDVQLSHHASGDAAIATVLDAYDAVADPEDIRRSRFIIVHCQFPTDESIERIVDRRVLLAMQTLFMYNMGEGYTKYHGIRGEYANPLRRLIDAGCHVGLGSDAPVNQYSPYMGAWHAMTRMCKATGKTMGAGQAITATEAFDCYTRANAYFGFRERSSGTLSAGKSADLAILEDVPDFSSLSTTLATKTLCTILDGDVVHGSLDAVGSPR